MLNHDDTLRAGATSYQDAIDALRAAGLPATFTQTGGMCAALEVMLDSGHTLLITDAGDTLSWTREEHQGWSVGLYSPDHADPGGECLAFDCVDDGRVEALLPVVDCVLRCVVHRSFVPSIMLD